MEPTASGDHGAVVALHYHENGWPPLPLPARMKEHPPKGLTGYDGRDLTAAEVLAHDWSGNLAVRMPDDVIGIDVDAYKGGAVTLADLTARLGELPATVMTHSNRNDGSGIRFFRVQAGHAWTTGLPGIEIVQRTHRYALVPPSMHPEGRRYAISDERDLFYDEPVDVLPPLDELPYLPDAWHNELSVHADSRTHARAADTHERDTFLDSYTGTDASHCLTAIVEHYRERTGAGYARHDTMQHCLSWAMEEARAGLFGATEARDALHQVWIVSLGTDARRVGSWEYDAMLRHAVGKANARTQDWINAKHDEHAGIPMPDASQSNAGGTQVSGDPLVRAVLSWEHAPDPFVMPRVEWLIEGLWSEGSYGELAGEQKTLKSVLATIIDVGLAAGVPVLGRFEVPEARPVLHLAGEGGRVGYWRSVGRVCDAYGIKVDAVRPNLRVSFNVAPVSNGLFRESLATELKGFAPGLVHLDPWYTYAPRGQDARQLIDVASTLADLAALCAEYGDNTALIINNHFNQSGAGTGLTRITGAGHAEWVDSWLLMAHREPPDVANGRFRLRLGIGSRQWGGTEWDLDLELGHFDPLTGQHTGAIMWTINGAVGSAKPTPQAVLDAAISKGMTALLGIGGRRADPFGKTELIDATAGDNKVLRSAWDRLIQSGMILPAGKRTVSAGVRSGSVDVFTVAPQGKPTP